MVAIMALASLVAAGGVVDVSLSSEGRATQRDVNKAADIDVSVAQGGLVLRPGIAGALEHEAIETSLAYFPALSLLAPVSDPSASQYAILHTIDARGEMRLGHRFSLRGTASGEIGELDPASAQSTLQQSSGVLDPFLSIPFGAARARVGASYDVTRRFGFDVDGRAAVASSLGDDRIPLTISPELEAFAFYDATRADSLLLGGNLQASSVDSRGTFFGGGPEVGWRKTLGRDTGFSITGGVGTYTASDDELDPITVFLPRVNGSIGTVVDLSGEAALEAGMRAGVVVINDPLGTLFENRASIAVDGGIRVTKDVAVRGEASVFAPAFVYAQRGPTSSTTLAERISLAWRINEHLSWDAGAILTTRVVEESVSTDAMVTLGISASAPIFHTGGRPAGSGGRFDVGETRVGDAPRPGSTIEEPEPLDVELPGEGQETPPELVPPSGVVSPDEAVAPAAGLPGSLRPDLQMRPLTDEEKKKADEAKKKRRDNNDPTAPAPDAKDADADADADAAQPKEEPTSP